jgi:hypothetical protein
VEEWMRTSEPKYPPGFDIDTYFGDRIESGISKIKHIIKDNNLDLQWFGINEED